jgi:hypothetical protein
MDQSANKNFILLSPLVPAPPDSPSSPTPDPTIESAPKPQGNKIWPSPPESAEKSMKWSINRSPEPIYRSVSVENLQVCRFTAETGQRQWELVKLNRLIGTQGQFSCGSARLDIFLCISCSWRGKPRVSTFF